MRPSIRLTALLFASGAQEEWRWTALGHVALPMKYGEKVEGLYDRVKDPNQFTHVVDDLTYAAILRETRAKFTKGALHARYFAAPIVSKSVRPARDLPIPSRFTR